MARKTGFYRAACLVFVMALLVSFVPNRLATAQEDGPAVVDPALSVETVLSDLVTPIGIAFLSANEMFVIEKNTGMVQHVMDGAVAGTALDLAVNFSSERGLLGITLDPAFDENGYVYLYWTCASPAPTGSPYFPSEFECADQPMTGPDTEDLLAVPLLGNRVDRFVWDGSTLTWDSNLVKLRAFQNDGAPYPSGQGDEQQQPAGGHNGGVIDFGEDGMLYVVIGDVGRRGALQNLPFGPIPYMADTEVPPEGMGLNTAPGLQVEGQGEAGVGGPDFGRGQVRALSHTGRNASLLTVPDDQFGGPYPDDAHFTGVVLRLNTDGTAPADNPFYNVGASVGGEVGENIQMIYAYGIRNSFGMDLDPQTGNVWLQENGEDAYDELNLVRPGFNSGWVQIMGPRDDIANYREIETTSLHAEAFPNLQQFRWGPENIATTPGEATRRLFRLPGSRYSDPEFSWEFVIAPAAIGFYEGNALGEDYNGDLFMGLAVPMPEGGPLLRFDLSRNRSRIAGGVTEAENGDFNSLVGSEQFLFGTGFGVVTDIETSPDGSLYIVSLDQGMVHRIFVDQGEEPTPEPELVTLFASLTGANEVPGPGDEDGSGDATVTVDPASNEVCFTLAVTNITLPATGAHIHVGAPDVAGLVVVPLTPPDATGMSEGCVANVDPALVQAIVADPVGYYVNVHNADFPDGAVRGQLSTEQEPQPAPVELFAELNGANEVPGPGDEDGSGDASVTIDLQTGELCYTLTAADITLPAAAAHIHVGAPDVAGPVVVPLNPPDASGMAEACASGVDPALLQAIVADPAGYYVNIHTPDFPDGAIRGQLSQ